MKGGYLGVIFILQ